MRSSLRSLVLAALLCLGLTGTRLGSAYNARPKLVVIIVIDQFRGDYLERYRDQWGEGGFRLLLDHGADFTDCNYDYANTRTAPGHATLLTGAYTNGHGIMANEWWDPQKKANGGRGRRRCDKTGRYCGQCRRSVPSHNLLADTLGDELKLATQGKSRVFGVALKDRAAVLPAGFAADGAYWIDRQIRRMDHFHLLPQRASQVGAGFQRQQAGRKVSEPGMEGRATAMSCAPPSRRTRKGAISMNWWARRR